MGNCQAAEAAAVLIQHPGGGKVDRIYWSVSANEIMNSNPGHYVALVVASPAARTENGAAVKQLKLLRPDDTLVIGQVYRLISFEDVLKEFAAKKCVKLGKLLNERGGLMKLDPMKKQDPKLQEVQHRLDSGGDGGGSSGSRSGVARYQGGGGGRYWRPTLQSISEIET